MTLPSNDRPASEYERVQDAAQEALSLETVLAVWHRRKWPALLILAVVLSAILPIVMSLPNIYESTATVLVQYYQTPQSLVGPLAVDDLETRLRTISQQIMSRARLYDVIKQFKLYPEFQRRAAPEATVERMRRDIQIHFNDVRQPNGLDMTVAFSLSYRGQDPQTVAQVTNALAALFVKENTKIREQETSGTTEFLRTQLADAKRQLEDQERKIGEYKERHIGELPEQQAANVAAVERLYSRLREIMDQRDARANGLGVPGAAVETTAARLARLRQELANLRTRYTDLYPDVMRLKQQIADLQRQPAPEAAGRTAAGEIGLAGLRHEEQAVRRAIAMYEHRIETAPLRESELQQLSRDEASARDLYQSLLQRYESAQLDERMQQHQGEQFRILDPAIASQQPVGPRRARFFLIGLVPGLAVAIGTALLTEAGDTSFRSADEVRATTGIPVLVSIPTIVTARDARRRRRRSSFLALAAALCVAAVFGASFYLARFGAVFDLFTGKGS